MEEKEDVSYGYPFIVLGFIYGTYHTIQSINDSISILNKILTLFVNIIIYGILAAIISVGAVSFYKVYTKKITDRKALIIALLFCFIIGILYVI